MKLAWPAGAAAAAIVVAAAVDAIRRDDSEPPAVNTTELRDRPAGAAELGRLGARGELVFREPCSVTMVALPSLEQAGPYRSGCEIEGAFTPDGGAIAFCRGERTELHDTLDGGLFGTLSGCPVALRNDLSYITSLRGEVVGFRQCADRRASDPPWALCKDRLIGRLELERAARRHPKVPDRIGRLRQLVEGLAWLSDTKVAVALSIRLGDRFEPLGPLSVIALFENGKLAAEPYSRASSGRLGASPRGSYVTRVPDVILRGDGSQISLPQHLRDARDFAWSPNERFLALATRFAVVVVAVDSLERYDRTGRGLRTVTLPQQATRLDWR